MKTGGRADHHRKLKDLMAGGLVNQFPEAIEVGSGWLKTFNVEGFPVHSADSLILLLTYCSDS